MIRREQRTLQRKRGAFTLMEMMVVVAIIVALAGMGGVYVVGYLNESKMKTAQIGCQTLENAIEGYYVSHSKYPGSLEDLWVDPTGGQNAKMKDLRAKVDPWGVNYTWGGQGSEVISTGSGFTISAHGKK
jgi:general secretion pathway protein G